MADETFGASNTSKEVLAAYGALAGTAEGGKQAAALARQMYPDPEKANPWVAAYEYFNAALQLASKPGQTTAGTFTGAVPAVMDYYTAKDKELTETRRARLEAGFKLAPALKAGAGKITYRPATAVELLKYGNKTAGQMGSDGKFYDLSPTSGGATKGQLFTFTSPEAAKTWLKANPTYELTEDQKNGTASILLPQSMGIIPANSSILTESLKPADPETVYKNFRTNYNTSPDVKKYEELKGHMDNVSTAYEQAYILEKPQVADLSMIFAYMKMLDPTSVVRESEQDQARRTGGAADWLVNYATMVGGGGSLTDEQRRSFRNGAHAFYENKTQGLTVLNERFTAEATERALIDRFNLYKITPKEYDLKVFGEYPGDDDIDALTGSEGLTTLSIIAQYDNINTNQLAKINQRIAQIKIDLGL
mgnify:CR=1 FL=1